MQALIIFIIIICTGSRLWLIVTASQPLVTLTAVSVAGGRKSLSTSPGDVADEKYRVLFRGGAAMTDLAKRPARAGVVREKGPGNAHV